VFTEYKVYADKLYNKTLCTL